MLAKRGRTDAFAASLGPSRRPPLLGASYHVGAAVLRVVPPGIRYSAAGPGGSAWFWLSRAQRRAALDNYAAALGRDRSDPEVARVARRAFQNYGRMLTDFVVIGSLTPDELIARTSVEGLEHIDEGLARGRGVITALPHMGSWDVAGSYAAALGYPVTAVAERFPGSLNDAVVSTRERFGMEVVMLGRAAVRKLTDALRANRVVALLCDLEQGPGVEVNFFGRRAIVPGGPGALALKTGAALLPVHPYAVGPSRHHFRIDPPLSWQEGDRKEDLMQKVVRRFEDFIKEHPDQWYAFRPMFASE